MSMRRFTRLTNGLSKKVENLKAHLALHYMFYNFGRTHETLRVTPAMEEAGVAEHVWSLDEIARLANRDHHPRVGDGAVTCTTRIGQRNPRHMCQRW